MLLSVEYGDIGQALARLSPEMRAVIQAVVLDGLSAKEAAHLLHTAALCAAALVPSACGCLALLRFVQLTPVSSAIYGPFSPSARVAILVGQIVVPALGGPLLGVALGRWVRFPGAAFVLFLLIYGWVSLVTILSMSHVNSALVAVLVVDVTPTGPVRRTQLRAVALLAPLAAGALVLLAAALRGQALPWAAVSLALAGNILLGFAVACVARTRTGEPGPVVSTAVVLVLMAPALVPHVARWVRTFPASGPGGPSSDRLWWPLLAVCAVAIAVSAGGLRRRAWPGSGTRRRRELSC